MRYYVAGDLGGTNCRLILVQVAPGLKETVVAEKTYRSAEHAHLVAVLERFLVDSGASRGRHPTVACIAVAGPVTSNRFAQITNLNWTLDAAAIAAQLDIRDVFFLNDFVAIGYGLLALRPGDYLTINDVAGQPGAPIACLGAGTGLGEVYLTHNGDEYDVWPSEGGHADFPARTRTEFDLMEFIRRRAGIDRVSVERIVSGSGLPLIYDYFKDGHADLVSDRVDADLSASGADRAEIIARHALQDTDVLCRRAFDTWLSAYGAEAGNMALKTLCFGGLYIAGGIAPKVVSSFKTGDDLFWKALSSKGRMRDVLERIPVHVVTRPNVGMLGAQLVCLRRFQRVLDHDDKDDDDPKLTADDGTNKTSL
ncbi:Glucokinase [Plasmodiophora brassicae]